MCLEYDVKLHLMGRFQLGSFKIIGKVELLLISITPTLTQSGSTSYGFNYGLNNLLPCRYSLGKGYVHSRQLWLVSARAYNQ